jgi:hypothetical protein
MVFFFLIGGKIKRKDFDLLQDYENVKPVKIIKISPLKISSLINIITFKIH